MMAIGEVLTAATTEVDIARERLADLRRLATARLAGLSSVDLGLMAQVAAYIEWYDLPEPAFRTRAGEADKFAKLVALSRKQQDCANFYVTDVGVDASTVWRWSNGKSRPSQFVGKSLAREIEAKLRTALWEMSYEQGLINKARTIA